MNRIGLIAGNRDFPIHVARAAKAFGAEVIAIALHEETSQELAKEVPKIHWIHLGQVGRLLKILKEEQLTQVLLAGQVHPSHATQPLAHLDAEGLKLLTRAMTAQGRDILKTFADYLSGHGIALLDSSVFLKDWIAQPGVLTQRSPTGDEKASMEYGVSVAQKIAQLGIGQTIAVKGKAVVAVEAVEGTDATLRRAAELAGPGVVVVKFAEPGHDRRFDIPVIGPETLKAMAQAGATALGVAAGNTLLLDRPQLIGLADRLNLAVVAMAA
ncbi:MAG: UDP-2,3-diacylglucosamine diphosphatase LpxI [Candidatus Omnitrophica bacterium]|nr:UDP-2,3-diacylglucosamine diphosphatase LpxI [Candidatus Omnitrophota bacterium]